MRLCTLNAERVIVRCFYGDEHEHPEAISAPSWALEGLNYDQAKADYEARIASGQDKADAAQSALDGDKLFLAKCVSDLAFRLGKNPGQLTAEELRNERDRIANIYKAL